MTKPTNKGNLANQYDKIIKENLEVTLPVIIKDVLGLNIMDSEEIPDDIQHTRERKPDALKKVTNAKGRTYILHIEFQTTDEKEMVYRMAEYSIMLMRKYHLPVKQYVIFLRDAKPNMLDSITEEDIKFRYNLIRISEANYKLFLKADNPEIKMLAILANFGKEDSYEAVKAIVSQVQSFAKSEFAENKYFEQLRIFVQLRKNVEQQLEKVMESVSKFFKEEDDFLFKKGEIKGEAKEQVKSVTKLIVKLGLSDEQVADTLDVSIDFVKSVRESLK